MAIVITNLDGDIEYVNPEFSKITGYTADEVKGKNPRLLKSEKTTSDEYKKQWKTITAGCTWRGEFLNVRKDGKQYWELASISPIIDENKNKIKYLAIKEDITERKLTEQKLAESNATKNMFFSIMAHDLRGPISGFLQLFASTPRKFRRDDYQSKNRISKCID